jgi:two-component system OmpR family sensor kinase
MATTARLISGGDLTHRVKETRDQSEVGQLGSAFNTMLEDIGAAFAERDATEERLRQFLADASHELRTPLTSIQGFAELARLGQPEQADATSAASQAAPSAIGSASPPTGSTSNGAQPVGVNPETALERIEEQAGRMRLLVEDLLLLARLDETREAERKPVDLTVLAADACTDAVSVAPERAVTFAGPEPVLVLGDASHLRQAISNLVSNAIRHTVAGTPIEVSSLRRDGRAVVSVRDHGAGLDEDALEHVFDRFWRADKSRSSAGLGLGLSIVEAIASEHGGRATASNADGGGAVFSIELPSADASDSGVGHSSASEPGEMSAGVPPRL